MKKVACTSKKITYRMKYICFYNLIVCMLLFATACSKKAVTEEANKLPAVGRIAESQQKAEEQNATVPVQETEKTNPLKITGYQLCQEKLSETAGNNTCMLAMIKADSQIDGKYLSNINILLYDKETIVLEYAVSDTNQEDGDNWGQGQLHLVSLDADTFEIKKDIAFKDSYYVQKLEGILAIEIFSDTSPSIKTYDYELNEIAEINIPDGASGYFSPDGKRYYYEKQKKIYVYNAENGVSKEVISKDSYHVENVYGVLTDDAGQDYVVFWGMAADYKEYQFILSVATGKVLRADAMEDRYSVITNNTYVEQKNTDMYIEQWMLGLSEDAAYDYEWYGEERDIVLHSMKNRDLLFTYNDEEAIWFYLYDYSTGTLKGKVSLDVSLLETPEEELSEDMHEFVGEELLGVQVYLCDVPVYTADGMVLLQLSNYAGDRFFYKWQPSVNEAYEQNMMVKEHEMGSLAAADIAAMDDNPLYSPEALSEELQPLRIKADELEKKYGVELYIGEECANIIGGYTIRPLLDYELVEESLNILDEEMGKYPVNFFSQFTYSWIDGLDIYLSSDLTGIEEDNLDTAGGFQMVEDSRLLLVLDCQSVYILSSTFHHELCHAIEEKITDASYSEETPFFNEEKWNSFNIYDDMYSNSYQEWGKEKYYDYTYENRIFDEDYADVCFVDTYAMSCPAEDRARIFESVMSDNSFEIEFEKAPCLKKKLNYYAQCIRKYFNTTGWKDVPWEAYMGKDDD